MLAGFYTYIHTRADEGGVFYVGKGRGARAHSQKGRNLRWQRTVAKHGMKVDIAARWPTEAEAFEHERLLISCFRAMGHPLCNMTDGGEGASGISPSAATRAKLSAAGLGRRLSEEAKQSISRKNRGRKRTKEQNERNSAARKGRSLAPETVEKIVAANTGKKRSAEARARISEACKGRVISAEHIEAIKKANTGIVRSAEFRANLSTILTGRPVSEETRRKISESNKGKSVPSERRARISASLKGRNRPEARRSAQKKGVS